MLIDVGSVSGNAIVKNNTINDNTKAGMEIHAFPHRQLFGALGAVIAIHNEIERLGKDAESKFRGLDIADMKFEKKVDNCSDIIKDTCGVRDCRLQVYKIGEDIIYSGGLCPFYIS